MAGSIIEKGKSRWLVRVFIGRDGEGKRKYLSELVHGGKRVADAKLNDLLQRKNAGTLTVRPKDTVGEYLTLWLETVAKPSVRTRTLHDDCALLPCVPEGGSALRVSLGSAGGPGDLGVGVRIVGRVSSGARQGHGSW